MSPVACLCVTPSPLDSSQGQATGLLGPIPATPALAAVIPMIYVATLGGLSISDDGGLNEGSTSRSSGRCPECSRRGTGGEEVPLQIAETIPSLPE